jgi:hypothetical protein
LLAAEEAKDIFPVIAGPHFEIMCSNVCVRLVRHSKYLDVNQLPRYSSRYVNAMFRMLGSRATLPAAAISVHLRTKVMYDVTRPIPGTFEICYISMEPSTRSCVDPLR